MTFYIIGGWVSFETTLLQAVNGVVLATEKKNKSILFEDHSTYKIEQITDNIGMVYSGMGPDYRLLIRRARKMAQDYYLMYHENIPTAQLVYRVALVMQVMRLSNQRL